METGILVFAQLQVTHWSGLPPKFWLRNRDFPALVVKLHPASPIVISLLPALHATMTDVATDSHGVND